MRSPECAEHLLAFFFSSRRRHTRSLRDWSSDVCSSDLQRFIRNDTYEPRINSDVRDLEAWSIGDTELPGGGHLTFLLNALRREQGVPGIATDRKSGA